MTLKFQFCLVCSLGDGEEKADGWMDGCVEESWSQQPASSTAATLGCAYGA